MLNQLKSWKFLFGLATAVTVGLASLVVFKVNSDRTKLQTLATKLMLSVEAADSNARQLEKVVDSLTNRLVDLNAKVEVIEAQKDLLKGNPKSTKQTQEKPKPATTESQIQQLTVSEPTFTVVNNSGTILNPKAGIKAGALRGIKVLAGSPFRVRKMEIQLARGLSSFATIVADGEFPDISAWSSQFVAGDRIIITIKRVMRITPNGEREAAFKNGVIIIPII